MSNWISSKLKKAESFLQQIDQQAAESLGHNELSRSEEHNNKIPTKIESAVPLKDQLKKKSEPERHDSHNLRKERKRDVVVAATPSKLVTKPMPLPKVVPPSTLTDSDWTELLSTPKQAQGNSNGMSVVRGSKKDVKKILEVKKSVPPVRRTVSNKFKPMGSENSVDARVDSSKVCDGDESGSSDSLHRKSGSGSGSSKDERYVVERDNVVAGTRDGVPHAADESLTTEKVSSMLEKFDGAKENQMNGDNDGLRLKKSNAAVESAVRQDSQGESSSESEGQTGSDSDSSSSSESENERKRREERERRREQIRAEKAAAKAVEAIKERENVVARLEGEKQSLEKILEERAKQQAQEASQLQTSMMETMDAVDLEKQKHNNTRMEALTRLAKLETANADLARSLAAKQWNLEVEANRVAELRQQLELKEGGREDLKRRMSNINQSGTGSCPNQEASKGAEFERDILEAEYSFTCDKIVQLREKANKLEECIEVTRNEMENPTAVEAELKRRLSQLTDHLIQKQAQVESLSSEKATLHLRIETTSRLLEESKSTLQFSEMTGSSSKDDLEAGTWGTSNSSRVRPMIAERIRSGGQHFESLLVQLDIIFSAGAAFLRRNSSAKVYALVYIVCLHFWVAYILMSNSDVGTIRSGAVISLETINKTTGS
ncbi:golgin candidate 2-like isoform X1 [Papaver somniferum]|uniref:golgin candidate 2-like isoform X1 n=2 Tax=Papaver somniferum TaxID=3469 RepID=UPI000E6F9B0B|nr:golgin candidate 2-like isoform X1 [Papaver somniferum]